MVNKELLVEFEKSTSKELEEELIEVEKKISEMMKLNNLEELLDIKDTIEFVLNKNGVK
jgi:hypothetical protein